MPSCALAALGVDEVLTTLRLEDAWLQRLVLWGPVRFSHHCLVVASKGDLVGTPSRPLVGTIAGRPKLMSVSLLHDAKQA